MNNRKEIVITIATIAAIALGIVGINSYGEHIYNNAYQQGYEDGMADSHVEDREVEIANLQEQISDLEEDNSGLRIRVDGLVRDVSKYQKAVERATSPKDEKPAAVTNEPATKAFRLNKSNNKLHDVDCGSGESATRTEIVYLTYDELMSWGNYCGNCDPEKTPKY